MEKIKSFFDLRTWKEGHGLVVEIYKATASFPLEERYGLTAQLRSAATSVPSNIAEGMGRASAKDLIRFLMNARGSIQEVIYQLYLAKDLKYINEKIHDELAYRYNGLAAGLNAHIERLRNYQQKPPSLND